MLQNIPRRYANMVYTKGLAKLDSINELAKSWIAPLPIAYDSTLSCYRDIFKQAKGHGGQNLPHVAGIEGLPPWPIFIMKNFFCGKNSDFISMVRTTAITTRESSGTCIR